MHKVCFHCKQYILMSHLQELWCMVWVDINTTLLHCYYTFEWQWSLKTQSESLEMSWMFFLWKACYYIHTHTHTRRTADFTLLPIKKAACDLCLRWENGMKLMFSQTWWDDNLNHKWGSVWQPRDFISSRLLSLHTTAGTQLPLNSINCRQRSLLI